MEKTFSFNSSKEHYHDAVCVVWCFDDRYSPLLTAHLEHRAFPHVDVIEVAGGAKALAEEAGTNRDFVLNQIKLSMGLHATKKAVLMVHMDCGGYGGSKAFAGFEEERAHHEAELRKAAVFLKKEYPELETELIVGDFDGVYAVS